MGQPGTHEPVLGKHRVVTYITPDSEYAQEGKGIEWLKHEAKGPPFNAIKEERLRVPLSILGETVRTVLQGYSKLYFKWVQSDSYDTLDPLAARVSPGLHVFFEARQGGGANAKHVCQMVNLLFGIEACEGQESFIIIPPEKLKAADSPPNQFYHPLYRLSTVDTPLVKALLVEALCGSSKTDGLCKSFFESLSSAASFDMSWDLTDQWLDISPMWPLESRRLEERPFEDCTSYVSVLHRTDSEPGLSPDQLSLEGHLYHFESGAQPKKWKVTVDVVKHRKHPGTFSAELIKPAGLHPTLQLNMKTQKPPAGLDHCKMYAYLTLPRNIFADRYQLQDALFLESKNLAALNFSSDPVDLEAPEYTVKAWGSTILVELAPKPDDYSDNPWKAQIPLHLRYMAPEAGGYARFDLPYPAVFWACEFPVSDHDKSLWNLWRVRSVGYDALFQDNTVFWHLNPVPRGGVSLYNTVVVPVANSDQMAWVGVGTALAVVLGTCWVIWTLLAAWLAGFNNQTSITTSTKKQDVSIGTSGKKTGDGSGVDTADDKEGRKRGE
jgi:hypothetical protein